MLVSGRTLLMLMLSITCMLGTTSFVHVSAQETGERRSERRDLRDGERHPVRAQNRDRDPDRNRDVGRNRAPDRNRDADRNHEVERNNEQRRLSFDFVLSDDTDGREIVERVVQDLRERFSTRGRSEREERQPARGGAQAREREHDEHAARRHHLEMAIEHLEAARFHDLAQELREHLHEPRPGHSSPRAAPGREPERRRPRAEGDERIRQLTERTEEFHGMLRGLQEQMGNIEAIGRATDEAHRGLDELRHQLEQRMQQFERAIHEASEGANQHVNHLERAVGERFEHMERNVAQRLEEVEEFLKGLDERLHDDNDGHDDDDGHDDEDEHDDDEDEHDDDDDEHDDDDDDD